MSEYGRIGDMLKADVFSGYIVEQKEVFRRMLAIHENGGNTEIKSRKDEILEVIRLYDFMLKSPVKFDRNKVRAALAALPTSVGGKMVVPTNECAIHMGLAYTYRDYSSLLPEEMEETIIPVGVFRRSPKSEWIDVTLSTLESDEADEYKVHRGLYVRCVGVASTIGGSVVECEYEDEVRVLDVPRLRCSACTKTFNKTRGKKGASARDSKLNAALAALRKARK